jgi:hypothetical protein
MGSISSTNPGLTDLLQTLSSADPSLLSSPSVTSALENASPSDIVQLSDAAIQLQSVDAMFGMPDASSTDPMTQALDSMFGVPDTSSTTDPTTQALDAMLGVPSSSSTSQSVPDLQAAETAALLGSTSNLTGSLLDVTG